MVLSNTQISYIFFIIFFLFIYDRTELTPLVKGIIKFDMKHNAEIPGCDLCLEIDQLNFLNESLDITNFERVCRYLESCAAYRSIFAYNTIIKIYEILSHLFFILLNYQRGYRKKTNIASRS